MPMAVQIMVNQRLKETEKLHQSLPNEDPLMDGLSLGSGSRNAKTDFNRTLGKKLNNFKQLLDEEDLDGPEKEEDLNLQYGSGNSLTSQQAKSSLAKELGKLKTELDDFTPEKTSGE